MSKPSSYDLLIQIQKSQNRLEDKLDAKIVYNTKKIDVVEGKVDNMLGKIGVGVMVLSAFIASIISFCFDFFKKE